MAGYDDSCWWRVGERVPVSAAEWTFYIIIMTAFPAAIEGHNLHHHGKRSISSLRKLNFTSTRLDIFYSGVVMPE